MRDSLTRDRYFGRKTIDKWAGVKVFDDVPWKKRKEEKNAKNFPPTSIHLLLVFRSLS